ncbi:MAG: NAD(P)-dependent oxidoreductase [Clostridia bacterium]|nr:NAD(P)-dependent oxidoreductase [Clostridia bacterium]
MKDWVGNASVRNCNLRSKDAEENDYYATEPKAVELLLEQERFSDKIVEPACGEGHISEVLKAHGYDVFSTDLIERGYGKGGVDFFSYTRIQGADIITNPPYKYAKEFIEHALKISADGTKIAMFLKLTFLEGKGRRDLFRNTPPQTVYVSSARLQCGKNGDFSGTSMVAYAWFVWQKGHYGPTNIKWIN